MANYRWDFGFDFRAVQDNNGRSFLESGFVSLASNPNTLATPVNGQVHVGDSISFRVFNLTDGATEEGYSITSGSITFRTGDGEQEVDSPFDGIGDSQAPISIGSLEEASATGSTPVFSLSSQEFPAWTVDSTRTVDNSGHFLFTAEVIVEGPNSNPRTFRVDPEMVIGSIG